MNAADSLIHGPAVAVFTAGLAASVLIGIACLVAHVRDRRRERAANAAAQVDRYRARHRPSVPVWGTYRAEDFTPPADASAGDMLTVLTPPGRPFRSVHSPVDPDVVHGDGGDVTP